MRNLARFEPYHIDFIEQPVREDPEANMLDVRSHCRIPVYQNEGLWTAEDAYRRIAHRTADVYCFNPYWVGSLKVFQLLSEVVHLEGLSVCRHTHGEFGIAAAACHHPLLTLPNITDGNQQTAQIMEDDVLREPLPRAHGADWGVPEGHGLCVEIDEQKISQYHQLYNSRGQFLPDDPDCIGKEL